MARLSQVILGFLGTGYLTFVVLVAYYLVSFDPEAYPFQSNDSSGTGTSKPNGWKPNPIDVVVLSSIRKFARRWSPQVSRIGRPRRFENAFYRVSSNITYPPLIRYRAIPEGRFLVPAEYSMLGSRGLY